MQNIEMEGNRDTKSSDCPVIFSTEQKILNTRNSENFRTRNTVKLPIRAIHSTRGNKNIHRPSPIISRKRTALISRPLSTSYLWRTTIAAQNRTRQRNCTIGLESVFPVSWRGEFECTATQKRVQLRRQSRVTLSPRHAQTSRYVGA